MAHHFRRSLILASSPAACGVALLIVSLWNLHRFSAGDMQIKTMLTIELPLFLVGFFLAVIIFFTACYWFVRKEWRLGLVAVSSVMIFLVCFGIAGEFGAAFLNAT